MTKEALDAVASSCLKCKKPRCTEFCPVHTPIPEIIALYQEGKIEEAGKILFSNNPLSAVCSIVCPHERNCAGHCIKGIKSTPVAFYEIEQFISREYLLNYKAPEIKKNGIKVAVIGAGPAGICAAILLTIKGFSVTVIEAKVKVGGVLRYGIPDFRLPRDLVDEYRTVFDKLGILFKPNTFVGSTLTLDDMFLDGYKAIFIAVGTSKPNKLGLLGETLGNVHYAIDYLKAPEAYSIGKKIAVVGAGNVALDAARTAIRHIEPGGSVFIINNRREEDMTGNRHEIADAVAEGVQFIHCMQTIKLCEDCVKCVRVDVTEEDGKITYTENFAEKVDIPADTVILAIGQGPQGAVVTDSNVKRTGRGLLDADENGNTTHPGVFAAGDVVSGPKTVVESVAFAKKVVDNIEAYLLNNPS